MELLRYYNKLTPNRINNLIDRNYITVSTLENISQVYQQLKNHEYLVVLNNEVPVGIITLNDLNQNPQKKSLFDFASFQCKVLSNHSPHMVLNLMQISHKDFLPVFESNDFIGVISLRNLSVWLANSLLDKQEYYQKVIHDLRNPISNINGCIHLLKDHDSIDKTQIMEICHSSCNHALAIVDELLYIETADFKSLKKQRTEMNTFLYECIVEQKGLFYQKGGNVKLDISNEKIYRDIDRKQFKRAVQNVISNSIKFSFSLNLVEIRSLNVDNRWILEIKDTGIGISKERFNSTGRSESDGELSTGLGLFFSKKCVEQHGGEIQFDSSENQGTSFYIKI
ncbi:MAG: CBS domain-containing protein [Sphingobacterium sp.]|jgi:signal transduction histidine kinase|nr:CBS domain-containing protein [Sphingobacterium sp.]